MHSFPGTSVQIVFRYEWRHWDPGSLLLPCVGEYTCLVCWNQFSCVWVMTQFEVFLYCSFSVTSSFGFQYWFDNKWLTLEFFIEICRFYSPAYLHGKKYTWSAHVCFSFDDIKIFDNFFEGFPGLFLKSAETFSHRLFEPRFLSFLNALQLYYRDFLRLLSNFFLHVVLNKFYYFW